MELQQALRTLFGIGCPTTAMSVLRLQFEALTRAMWMLYAATDLAIQKLTAPLTVESERVGARIRRDQSDPQHAGRQGVFLVQARVLCDRISFRAKLGQTRGRYRPFHALLKGT